MLEKDAKKFIENDGSKRYSILKYSEAEVRAAPLLR